jgi:hypothetical protein
MVWALRTKAWIPRGSSKDPDTYLFGFATNKRAHVYTTKAHVYTVTGVLIDTGRLFESFTFDRQKRHQATLMSRDTV